METHARLARAVVMGGFAILATVELPAAVPDALAQVTLPITQARPDTGSRIRRDLVKMTIPASDPWDQLTPQQRTAFLAHFSNLGEGDEPPYPREGLLPLAKSMVFEFADGPVGEGELFLTVKVDEKGEPQSVAVYATPSTRISKEAAAVLMAAKYKPALCKGKPCTSEFPFTARFEAR